MERLTERTGEGQSIPRMDLKNNGHQKCMERLAEYEDLEERGKLLKLPCAVGDTVYRPYINTVIEMEVISIVVQHIIQIYYYGTSYRSVIEDFGKTVFLTREEAEAALKEMDE